jgi:sulfatase maturation enzyme AslB (radical SAM superfamily)
MKVFFEYTAKKELTKAHEKNHFTDKSVKREFYKLWEKSISENWERKQEKSLTITDTETGLKIWFSYDVFESISPVSSDNVIIVKHIECTPIWGA